MPRTIKYALMVATVCAVCIACKRTTILHTYRHTPVEGWEQSDVLVYDFDSVKLSSDYSVAIGVRTTNAYPYKKLWLVVEQRFRNPVAMRTDTLACNFVDNNEERDERGTNTYQYVYNLGTIRLERGQTGQISIRHIMRREILPGVSDIGVKLYR